MMEQNFGPEDHNETPKHRITVQGARKMLGMIGKNYDDEEITDILGLLYSIAEESFEVYSDGPEFGDSDE